MSKKRTGRRESEDMVRNDGGKRGAMSDVNSPY